jgi:cystathionine gamma-lyase
MKFETKIIHAGYAYKDHNLSITPPIYTTSTFFQENAGENQPINYSRISNPSRSIPEEAIASIENGDAGFLFASGMAAINAILELLPAGSHILCADDVYGGTVKLLDTIKKKTQKFDVTYINMTDLDAVAASLRHDTKLIWFETPSNPTLKIIDIDAVCKLSKKFNALVAVDNTFASPYVQNPLDHGADLVMHSASKYLNGHSDIIAGVVITKTKQLSNDMRHIQTTAGAILSPFDCYLLTRGLKTLSVRMERHLDNAEKIAQYLSNHPKIETVYYPGLPSHVGHDVAKKQMRGFGGMITFVIKADLNNTIDFCQSRKLMPLATSLGGIETLLNHSYTMSHGMLPVAERLKKGIVPGMVRLSVGIENINDLIDDIECGLKKIP